jgi:glycosyltransferase involved in cell wall biosynthesis
MRILHVFPTFRIGGSQVRFAALAEALGTRLEHTVIAIDGNHAARVLLPACLNVSYADAPAGRSLLSRVAAYRAFLRDFSADILVTYNWGAIEWAIANAFGGTPHIHMEDGFGPEEVQRQIPRRRWARRLLLRHSTIVVPSIALSDIAVGSWKIKSPRLLHIPNGIACRTQYKTAIPDLGLNLPPDLPRIVWAGALRPEKNPLRLLQAFAPLRGKAILLMLGGGPQMRELLAEAERLALMPFIRILGDRPDARDIIMQCDVMALSSDTEQMPFAILEGMDAGLAVASVDVGDVRQMVAAENRPFIVAAQGNALAKALDQLVRDRPLRNAIGLANKRRIRECYDLRTMAARYAALFASIAAPARQGPLRHV